MQLKVWEEETDICPTDLPIRRPTRYCLAGHALAWDHPGRVTTAAISFKEIEKARPELIEKLQVLFLSHPGTAPFWVAAGEARGKERARRMFLECARWAGTTRSLHPGLC